MKLEIGTETTFELGTVATTLVGTDDGTFDQAITTTDGLETSEKTKLDATFDTKDTGTTTGLETPVGRTNVYDGETGEAYGVSKAALGGALHLETADFETTA
jgi:hypothetical protein